MKVWHWIGIIAIGVLIMGSSLFHYWTRPDKGEQAPDFALMDLNGESVSLNKFRGKVVLLHFWATWCGPCREELPFLEELHQKMKDKPLAILTVSLDGENAQQEVEKFRKYVPFTFPVLLDKNSEVADLYHTLGVPESILIGPYGKIIGRMNGPQNWTSKESLQLFEKLFANFPTTD